MCRKLHQQAELLYGMQSTDKRSESANDELALAAHLLLEAASYCKVSDAYFRKLIQQNIELRTMLDQSSQQTDATVYCN